MKTITMFKALLIIGAFTANCVCAQSNTQQTISENEKDPQAMKTYLIEREIPDAGNLTDEQLKGISQKSNEVLAEMGPQIEWLHSYVTDDKVYCVYKAQNKEAIEKHAKEAGFPANSIRELSTKIDPGTAEE